MKHSLQRPHTEPAASLFDVLIKEAGKPRAAEVGLAAVGAKPVQRAAQNYAAKHGLRVPTLEDVTRCEMRAARSSDYVAKWARSIADHMHA